MWNLTSVMKMKKIKRVKECCAQVPGKRGKKNGRAPQGAACHSSVMLTDMSIRAEADVGMYP